MRLLDHPNVVSLKHCFFSTTEKDELYLNLVLEYVPETVHRVIKHYNNNYYQRMPLIYVKLYTYQVLLLVKNWFPSALTIRHVLDNVYMFMWLIWNELLGNCLCLILLEQRYLNVKLVLTWLRVSDWCSTPWTVSPRLTNVSWCIKDSLKT